MVNTTLIRVKDTVKDKLEELKVHHRETYGDIVERLLDNHKKR